MTYFLALICVAGIASGQILFKLSASSLEKTGSWFHIHTMTILGCAFALYGITTILWIYVLQKSDLGKIYPLMALSFAIVPIASHFVFGERFQPQYLIGLAVIMLGIVITVRS